MLVEWVARADVCYCPMPQDLASFPQETLLSPSQNCFSDRVDRFASPTKDPPPPQAQGGPTVLLSLSLSVNSQTSLQRGHQPHSNK